MLSVQVVTAFPISSNPVLQEYVAVSPTELPVNVTSPLLGLLPLAQSAEKRQVTYVAWYHNNLRRQIGCAGTNDALFPPRPSVQVVTAFPISSNPVLQVYVAVFPTELPTDVTSPLLGLLGLEHRANKETNNCNRQHIIITCRCQKN